MAEELDIDTPEGMSAAVDWQTKYCDLLKEGGKWGIPRSESIYTIYKSKKLAVRTAGEEGVDRVFREMGWEVRETI